MAEVLKYGRKAGIEMGGVIYGQGAAAQQNAGTQGQEPGTRSMGEILIRQEEGQDSRRRTVSFSSETPYRRYFGMEILDHAEGAVDWGA